MEIGYSGYEETSFLQGDGVRSRFAVRIGNPVGEVLYRSDSNRRYMHNFTVYNENDYIAFVGLELAEKWAKNMQIMYDSDGVLDKDTVARSLVLAKEMVVPYHIDEENLRMATEILVAHWAYGEEFGRIICLSDDEMRRIRAKAEVQTLLDGHYGQVLENQKINFSSSMTEKYWNFKSFSCDVVDRDCFDLAGDWIKVAQLFMQKIGETELTEDILYESALLVRQHNPLAKTAFSSNVLKIRDDYYNRTVQAMICCWDRGEDVGRIHSTDNTSIAKIRKFPSRDNAFKCYMRDKSPSILHYAVGRLIAKIHE